MIIVHRFGTITQLEPTTADDAEWLYSSCAAEPWQWMGSSLNVEPRYAGQIIGEAMADGLTVKMP